MSNILRKQGLNILGGSGGDGDANLERATYDVTPATKPHAVDSFIYFNNVVYKVTSAISIGDTIAVGTNITADTGLDVDTQMYVDGKPDSGGSGTVYRRDRQNIVTRLNNLAQAVSEQNLEKYGYSIGDYFDGASGYTYTLGDYNTFKGTSTPYCIATNHLGIIVDTHATHEWHSGDVSSVGYGGSTLHSYLSGTVLDNIKADFTALFGSWNNHLLAHSKLFTNALADWTWYANQYISALTCTQIDAGSQWTANGFQEGEASKSLELFRKYKWTEIFGSEYPWLRNISNYDNTASYACYVDADGGALVGNLGVTYARFAVGLIIFN